MRPFLTLARKLFLFSLVLVLALEALVRICHLYKETPRRFIDDRQVEKWEPGQHGYSVTGNRRQNFSEYRINQSGFNSYREYTPSAGKKELALIGDSFIEGFHQDYDHSLGKKIEDRVPGLEVYEYGYGGYDLADELHLIQAYREDFDKVDLIFVYLRYRDDLTRGSYTATNERLKLQQGVYRWLKLSKLLVYIQNIGLLGSVRDKVSAWASLMRNPGVPAHQPERAEPDATYLKNLQSLLAAYPPDPSKTVFLFDGRSTPEAVLHQLDSAGLRYLDYGKALARSREPVTLIYDQHWNDHGRTLIAESIADWVHQNR